MCVFSDVEKLCNYVLIDEKSYIFFSVSAVQYLRGGEK